LKELDSMTTYDVLFIETQVGAVNLKQVRVTDASLKWTSDIIGVAQYVSYSENFRSSTRLLRRLMIRTVIAASF